jgi:hypothetical protein
VVAEVERAHTVLASVAQVQIGVARDARFLQDHKASHSHINITRMLVDMFL